MSHTISGKLKENARSFTTQNGQGFAVRIGKPFKDHTSPVTLWTNYEAVLFAKTPEQIAYYQKKLVAGSVLELHAKHLKVVQSGNNNEYTTLELVQPTVDIIHQGQSNQPMQQTG